MKTLIAKALPFETDAVSIAALQQHDFILGILARINVAASRRPRPLAADSVVTLLGTPGL